MSCNISNDQAFDELNPKMSWKNNFEWSRGLMHVHFVHLLPLVTLCFSLVKNKPTLSYSLPSVGVKKKQKNLNRHFGGKTAQSDLAESRSGCSRQRCDIL